jgi:CubicO group peptidase (beta-lactamase class C family)
MRVRLAALALMSVMSVAAAQDRPLRDDPRVRDALGLLAVWAEAQAAYQQIPGISLAVVHDQELVWSAGFGLANRESRVPATATTIYSICSISKLFTSVALMQLRDAGKVRLDDSVARFLPWFAIPDTFPDPAPITLEGLLTHASGVPRESDFPYWSAPDFRFPTHDELVRRLADQQQLYPPETYFQYSNLGLALAGEIVAAVSGEPYVQYEKAHVISSLGLANTTAEIPTALHGTRMAVGYSSRTRSGTRDRLPVFDGGAIDPAMGFASTVEDLGAFASWQFRVLYRGAHEVLARNTLREMQRVHWVDPDWKTTWGLGFAVSRDKDKTFVGHGGSCPGYRSNLLIQPGERVAVVFAANASGVDAGQFTRRGYEVVAPAFKAAADTASRAPVTSVDVSPYVGAYSEMPWGGEVAAIPWKGSLALLSLPTDDPMGDLVELKYVAGNSFRRIRDDQTLGEEIRFDVGPDGKATRLWQHSNFSPRIR